MTLVAQPWQVYVQVMDLDKDLSGFTLNLSDPAAVAADAEAARVSFVAAWPSVSQAIIYQAVVRQAFYEDTAVVGAGNNAVKATVVCRIDPLESGKTANLVIPAPAQGIFVAASGPSAKIIDPLDAGLLAYVELFTTTDGVFSISDGETLVDASTIVGGRRP